MVKFIDLETGNTFLGESPYIFWFPKGQGVNMIYSLPICFVCDKKSLNVSIPNNPIFNLIDINKINPNHLENINGINYEDLDNLKCNNVILNGEKIDNYYIYVCYIIAQSEVDGEFTSPFYIDNDMFKIGADFYSENEALYINLSNNGQDIPKEIQKSLYPSNVHEDKIDNILLNRKWKELLSNYWDVVANKGSYKSLVNSLNWFEYGNLLQIFEVWKHYEDNKEILDLRNLQEILGNKYFETLNGFAKTTYISIQLALDKIQKENNQYQLDENGNPKLIKLSTPKYGEEINKYSDYLKNVSSIWSYNDLALKLSLLGNFYKRYFMPIHLDLIHCTIYDIVFTAPLKIITGAFIEKYKYNFTKRSLICNIQSQDTFELEPLYNDIGAGCEAGSNTLFNKHLYLWDKGETPKYSTLPVGVSKRGSMSLTSFKYDTLSEKDNIQLKSFLSQYYNGIGAIVPVKIQLDLPVGYSIFESVLNFDGDVIIDKTSFNKGNIEFNILCTQEKEYKFSLQFKAKNNNGEEIIYEKSNIIFNVVDTRTAFLTLYKVQNNQTPKGIEESDLNYVFGRQLYSDSKENIKRLFVQYIPACKDYDKDWKGVALSNILIFNMPTETFLDDILTTINKYYDTIKLKKDKKFEEVPGTIDDVTHYLICISKEFGFDPTDSVKNTEMSEIINNKKEYIYINKYSFIPSKHKLVKFNTNLKDYIITNDDTLCVYADPKFGKYIEEVEWEFINQSKLIPESIKINRSVSSPFISQTKKQFLSQGYYDIIFKYKFFNKLKQAKLESVLYKREP